ncbi:MAG TPA: SMP-30/gluconolactonase/LRE family protein [Pyrinomonadaceae bacterium]|nr:SMP-30/gluconolactonase/LRE family protein [Pyrinomonadaceae bacterium]
MTRRTMLIQLCAASIGARFALGQNRPDQGAAKDLSKKASAPGVQTLLTGLGFGESPRWHKDRLWFSNWGKQEIVAVDHKGKSEVMVRLPFASFPFSIAWLPNGSLLIVSTSERPLLRQQNDGSLVTHADLSRLPAQGWNEIVVDGRGNTYINGGDLGGKNPISGIIALVPPDGSVRQVADGLAFPNGMAVTPNNSTLIVAESFGKRLTAFDIASNGSLSNRRVWADLKTGVPDGISADAEGAIWYADVPNKRCVRVREGGEVLQTVNIDRGCFACMLGGTDRRTLFILAADWLGFEKMMEGLGTGQVLTVKAPAPGIGWP